jgi:hypothetical protein
VNADDRQVSRAGKALAIALAFLAPARMAWIVFTVGENNLSNDYLARVPVVAALLEGRYPLRHLFRDTWIGGGHSWLALLPIYWFDARFFAWDVRVELGIGLALTALKAFLVWLALAPSLSARRRWFLLPVLFALAFSAAQTSSFTFGESVLQMQLAQVAVAAGLLALVRFADRPTLRASSLAVCGLLASWSWGGGVMAWPVFAAALFLAGERSLFRWALLSAGAGFGLAQYVWYLVVRPFPQPMPIPGLRGLPHVLDLLGRPFANSAGTDLGPSRASFVFGVAGVALTGITVWAARRNLRERLPGLALLGWSVLLAAQISAVRSDIAPWYIVPMTAFWLALAGLFAAAPRRVALAGFLTLAAGFLHSNRTWESFYLPSRAPASAACLREWRTTAVACHDRLFQWGGTNLSEAASLGEPLERLHLSVFSSRRTYLLQGDVAVGRVIKDRAETAFLSRDGATPADPNDFRRLDLVMAGGASVRWRVDLPPVLKRATFETRLRARKDDPMLARGARVTVEGTDASARALAASGSRAPLALDLGTFAGRTVVLRLAAEEAAGSVPVVLEAPRILLELEAARPGKQ